VDPKIESKSTKRGNAVVYLDSIVNAVKTKRLPNLSAREGGAALQRAVITILDIVGVAVTRPPAHHARRWRRAGAALARAVRVENVRNLRRVKRAVKYFDLVD